MEKIKSTEVAETFKQYPAPARKKLLLLRQLILDVAAETEDVGVLEETLKWGEPAYLTKTGSTIRLGWKKSAPDRCAMYFHCKTKLVDTFRELYRDVLKFEGNRAIIFSVSDAESDELPVEALKHCIALSLTYHRIKHLPLLGA